MRKIIIFLSFTIISATVITLATPGGAEKVTGTATAPKRVHIATEAVWQDLPGTIDGSVSPHLIPDDVAYSLFFNFVAGRGTEKEKDSLKSYLQQVQLGDIDLEALISVSQEYQNALNNIDTQQSALARANHQSMSNIETQLKEFKQRKLALVNEGVESLPDRLGRAGAENVRRHVMDYIKRKVKIIPGPVMPPTAH